MAESLTLHCGQVATALGYFTKGGEPNRVVIRRLAREGRIPPPIDDTLTVAHWRWSRAEIEAYVAGTWRAAS